MTRLSKVSFRISKVALKIEEIKADEIKEMQNLAASETKGVI